MINVDLSMLDSIQAWLSTPVNISQPGVTYGAIIAFIIIIIIIAKLMDGGE